MRLDQYFDNDGITSEFYMGDGDFDGAGNTYPAAALPQTGGVTDDGIPFLFVNGVEGTNNNVTTAGQTIEVPAGGYARLHLLGASAGGNADAPMTATYADGSTAPVPLQLTDWKAGPAYGETEAVRAPQYHSRAGAKDVKVAIFHQVVDVDPARQLVALALPTARAHLFAITLAEKSDATR